MKNIFILLSFCILSSFATAKDSLIDLELNQRILQEPDGKIFLEFTLKNKEKYDIAISEFMLPWGNQYSALLVPVTNDSNVQKIPEILYIDDPIDGTRIIEADAEITGSIDLFSRFSMLRETLTEKSVILFFVYRAKTTSDDSSIRFTGAVFIPKIEK